MGLVGDAKETVKKLNAKLNNSVSLEHLESVKNEVIEIKRQIEENLTKSEKRHKKLLTILRAIAPLETIFATDACQLSYTGVFDFNISEARKWLHPVGFCALGNALPNAIGVKMALPMTPVAVLVGDGGFMFSMPELLTAKEQNLSLPIIIWENGGYKQIQDDMGVMKIDRVGVEGLNPDFIQLAKSCHCEAVYADSAEVFMKAFKNALSTNSPTIILVQENDDWLN